MKTSLSATMRPVLIAGTTLSVVLGLLFLLFRILQPFLFIFLAAFILSVFLNPVFVYLHQRLRLPKTISAALAIFVAILALSIPLSTIMTLLISETDDVLTFIQANAGIRNELTQAVYGYLNQLGISTQNFELEINKYIVTSLRFVSMSLTSIISQAFGLILNGFLALLVTFNFLMHKETIFRYVTSINLLSQANTERLISRATEVMTATIRGNFIVITIQALLGGVGFVIFGLSSPVLLGSLYGLASLIPVIGITLVWLPAATYLVLSGNLFGGIGLVVWCIGSNLLMDNVVGPTIIALSFVALEMYRQLLKE